jgi:hypothetical protein
MPGFSFKEGPGIFYGVNVFCWIIIRDFFKKISQLTKWMRRIKSADFTIES